MRACVCQKIVVSLQPVLVCIYKMRKIFSLIIFICFTLIAYAKTVFTFESAADMSQTKDGISVVLSAGSGNAPSATTIYLTGEPEMRLYVNNTITVSGTGLTNIQMVFAKSGASNKDYSGLSASTGTLVNGGQSESYSDWKVDSWTGNATQVVFTLTGKGQRRIQKIVVDGDPVDINPGEVVLPTAEDLDTDWTYEEPTVILPKDTVIAKKEYAFIDNNILVHCSLGSIMQETDTTFAYFNCNAGYALTFTATQPIKGIEIDGFVRKAFNATCDEGEIEYLTDVDFDMEGWPAMVIRNIDAKSVTLSCPKQLRCYGVRVYFNDNPNHLGVENVESETDSRKVMRDGQLLIIHHGRLFTATGTEIQ